VLEGPHQCFGVSKKLMSDKPESDKLQLKVNMIFGGAFYSQGTIMEARKIPPNLRCQTDYVGEPGSVESPYSQEEDDSNASG